MDKKDAWLSLGAFCLVGGTIGLFANFACGLVWQREISAATALHDVTIGLLCGIGTTLYYCVMKICKDTCLFWIFNGDRRNTFFSSLGGGLGNIAGYIISPLLLSWLNSFSGVKDKRYAFEEYLYALVNPFFLITQTPITEIVEDSANRFPHLILIAFVGVMSSVFHVRLWASKLWPVSWQRWEIWLIIPLIILGPVVMLLIIQEILESRRRQYSRPGTGQGEGAAKMRPNPYIMTFFMAYYLPISLFFHEPHHHWASFLLRLLS